MEIKFICEKCGKEQQPDKAKSNDNWQVYDSKQKCECGGKYTAKVI
jgi:hypothetical protein